MVTQQKIFEKIGSLLDELSGQYDFLKENPEEQKGVYLELFEANMSYLMGHVTILKKITSIDNSSSEIENSTAERNTPIDEGPFKDFEEKDDAREEQKKEYDHAADLEEDAANDLDDHSETETEADTSDQEKQENALNYVEQQEVKETYFTPATAHADEKAEEFKLEDKKDKGEEATTDDTKEETIEEKEAVGNHYADTDNKLGDSKEQDVIEGGDEDSDDYAVEGDKENMDKEEREIEEEASPIQENTAIREDKEEEEAKASQVVEESKSFVLPSEEVKEEKIVEKEEIQEPKKPMTLNELFSAQRKQEQTKFNEPSEPATSLPHQEAPTKRITDIKSAVSLNDKLLFIKDLFNGYSLAYTEAIELLSRYDNFKDADAFLQNNYAQKNNWANKQTTVDKLYAILKQRFG
ncbi:hypothetical protein [Olivibacter domesticus]|uniref:Uncharacterized protein n=1 Tax=Olivibacter domesticus TaxID=407022 RepID=A0A1H7YMZ8_OLID1|nr:hypothetical protein [Olivibacter domesticus]SEM46658.1 hypothetical protein SAMN05661044_05271 [Olivibacter domesticus]